MTTIPVIIKVLVIFALVVAATAKRMHLGLAAALGGLLFGLWSGLSPAATITAAVLELLDPDTILLLILIISIMALSEALKKSGALKSFAEALSFVAPSPRSAFALTPLLIGTLPMPGGAILSAPLVGALDPERRQGADGLSAINYWFRHMIELVWPLYPAFILTTTISGLSVERLMLVNLYAPLFLVTLGQIFVVRREGLLPTAAPSASRDRAEAPHSGGAPKAWKSLAGFLPLAILLGVYGVLAAGLKAVESSLGVPLGGTAKTAVLVHRYLPVLCGIAASALYVERRYPGKKAFTGTLNAGVLKLAAVIAGIRIFASLLDTCGAATAMAGELSSWGIPALLAAVLLPFISGLVTGVGFAYVGIAFPIVLGLFPPGGPVPTEAAISLAGAFGWAGMMLSPLHVCMVVTSEHFGIGIGPTLKRVILPLGLFLLIALSYSALLTRLL